MATRAEAVQEALARYMEVGLDRALSSTKGCYLGQEVVERIAARGHVNRKLVGLVIDGTAVPAPGAALRAAERDVGRITSAVRSVALDRVIGLGFVHRSYGAEGSRLEVANGGTTVTAAVTAIPFRQDSTRRKEE